MKITQCAEKINLNQVLDICVDVHKETLNFFFSVGGKEFTDECRNRTTTIKSKMKKYHAIAIEHSRKTLRIICEPTGQYQNALFRTARKMGFLTNYVNAEAVSKFRVVESNDNNKTDKKDPRVIRTLGELGKVIKFRMLGDEYLMLRKLHKIYDELEVGITSIRCRISKMMVELFCDYSFKKDFLYSRSGMALVTEFGCNPYKIVNTGFNRFGKTMKGAAKWIRQETIKRLWDDAQSSVLNEQPEGYIEVLEDYLNDLYTEYLQHVERKEKVVEKMIAILNRLRQDDPNIPPPTPHVISDKNMARLLGETGPLVDFEHWRKLMRYAGLNIRMRQSGTFKGKNKITKKGRRLLRKALNTIVFPLVKSNRLYGEKYHKKKEATKMPGNKLLTVYSRQFLRKFYGWYKSGEAFDEKRFFTCKNEYLKLAEAA